jgi:hypothetical protein
MKPIVISATGIIPRTLAQFQQLESEVVFPNIQSLLYADFMF